MKKDFIRTDDHVIRIRSDGARKPMAEKDRSDTKESRDRILNMSYDEWKKMERSKGTLHYLKKKVKEGGQYKIVNKNAIQSR